MLAQLEDGVLDVLEVHLDAEARVGAPNDDGDDHGAGDVHFPVDHVVGLQLALNELHRLEHVTGDGLRHDHRGDRVAKGHAEAVVYEPRVAVGEQLDPLG